MWSKADSQRKQNMKTTFKHIPSKGVMAFDIETAPLDNVKELMPPFDPAMVKLGNTKDADKVAARIEEARANYESDFLAAATLDARYCRVLAIGIMGENFQMLAGDEEDKNLSAFWQLVQTLESDRRFLVGYYTHLFDLPILIQRSWFHGISVPAFIRVRRYWWDGSIDLHERFQCGNREMHTGGLNGLAKFFGVQGKVQDVDGAKFHELWKSDRQKAIAYLKQDCAIVKQICPKMGII